MMRMQRLQAFKYELMLNGSQRRFAGCCRRVFNDASLKRIFNGETARWFSSASAVPLSA